MDFQDFLKFVTKFPNIALPARNAHYKMAPQDRIESLKNVNIDDRNPKQAAVLMLLYPKNGKTTLVLIVRNTYKGVHSAQIAFPGGKYESDDENFQNTALRETYEEVGVDPQRINVIMPFTSLYIPVSNYLVNPFLGVSTEEIVFTPDKKEVAEIIELPLLDLLNDNLIVDFNLILSDASAVAVPAFKIGQHMVWGATAMMLNELKEVIKIVL
jgi:8-oxo-dGTP pyrophosphatase MutT (NUDIX family)